MDRERRWAWAVPWVLGNVVGEFAGSLVDLVGEARTAGMFGLTGVALGVCWYWLFPRPLVERLRLVGVAVVAGSCLALLFGGHLSHPTVRSMIGAGVLAGLILAESWRPGQELSPQRPRELG